MKQFIPKILKRTIKKLLIRKKHLLKSLKNSAVAFTPGEINYSLALKEFDGFLMAYRNGTTDEDVLQHSFEKDIFFNSISEYYPGPTHVVLDVGAHIGTFSIFIASKLKHGQVYALEASKETYNYLYINKELNNCNNVKTYHQALADKTGVAELYHGIGHWGHSLTFNKSSLLRTESVNTVTLSDFFYENDINHCDLIRFNCEGAEFSILMATPQKMLRRIAFMLIYFHCDLVENGNQTLEDLVSYLTKCGFDCRLEWKKKHKNGVCLESKHRGYIAAIRK